MSDRNWFRIAAIAAGVAGITTSLLRKPLVRGEASDCWQQVMERAAWGATIEDPATHVFWDVNRSFAQMHGYSVEDLIGRPCIDLLAPEHRGEFPTPNVMLQNDHHVYESMHIRQDGSRFPVLTDVTAYRDNNDRVTFLAATHQDITDRWQVDDRLRRSRDDLESRVAQRTVALHQVSRQLLRLQDEERRSIAHELHDTIGQHLVGLKMNLEILRGTSLDERGTQVVEDSLQIADRCIAEIRTVSYLLHPPLLDERGLASALRWYVDGFAGRSGIAVRLDIPEHLGLGSESEIVLFRIVQECLTNIHRHSGSQRADVRLLRDNNQFTLEVQDYGRGIPQEALDQYSGNWPTTVGLAGMRERVTELDGRLDIQTGIHGTVIRASLPARVSEPPCSR